MKHLWPQHVRTRLTLWYVAILAGVGGWSGAIVAGGLDPRDQTAALGFVGAMGDLPNYTARGGMLYVFALP